MSSCGVTGTATLKPSFPPPTDGPLPASLQHGSLRRPVSSRSSEARLSEPQIGGVVIRFHKDELFVRPWVQSLEREKPE